MHACNDESCPQCSHDPGFVIVIVGVGWRDQRELIAEAAEFIKAREFQEDMEAAAKREPEQEGIRHEVTAPTNTQQQTPIAQTYRPAQKASGYG